MSERPDEQVEGALLPGLVELKLQIHDRELIEELSHHREGREREEFARAALRIGVLALRQVHGQLEAQTVRSEIERMLEELRTGLAHHQSFLGERLSASLREYFDPTSGRFAERVDRLTREDGELATVIRREVSGDGSELARTLAAHLGAESPLMKLVDPSNAEGLLAGIGELVNAELLAQREQLLSEFSLDNKEGSLARLVFELREHHGRLTGDLGERIDEVVREFSLDREDSALSRLVQRVERAQQRITDEFTLDSDTSALARLRRELMEVAHGQSEKIASMEKTVAVEMAALAARRAEVERSTLHGDEFEDAVAAWLSRAARQRGDLFCRTGSQVGQIKNRKWGDAVIELGPEHEAQGSRIVFEAKEDRSYTTARALQELELARKNRGAELGVFVFSRVAAPAELFGVSRFGSDLIVVWDRDDASSDVYLDAALSICRALATRGATDSRCELDLAALDRAIRDIEKQIAGLEQIKRSAETIESGSQKILERVRLMNRNLVRGIEALDECAGAARHALGG